jgi:hypothetical protein
MRTVRHHKPMRFRLRMICLIVAFVVAAQAQTQKINLDELKQMISSSLALKYDDKKIAEYLKHVQLTEKLTDPMIEQYMAMGAGARTVHELQVLRDATAKQFPAKTEATTAGAASADQPQMTLGAKHEYKPIPPPDSVKQAQILDLFREYALNYTKNMPNFICLEVMDRFVYVPRVDREMKIDRLEAQLSYTEGHEQYHMLAQNGKELFSDMDKIQGGSVSSGEFASMMSEIFEPRSEASFEWLKWGTLRGQRVAEYNYHIDSGHSVFTIRFDNSQRIVTAYKGVVEGDPDTGIIYRITFEAVDIPAGFPVREATDILDYGEVQISGNPFILPINAKLNMMARTEHGEQKTHNEIGFKLYRKFGTDSTFTPGEIIDAEGTPSPGGEVEGPPPVMLPPPAATPAPATTPRPPADPTATANPAQPQPR